MHTHARSMYAHYAHANNTFIHIGRSDCLCVVLSEIHRYGFLAEHMFSRAHIAATSLSVAYGFTLHHYNCSATTISGLCVCVMLCVAFFCLE